MYSCSSTTKIALLVSVGLGFALTAILSYILLPFLIQYNVKQKLILSPDSMTFDGWQRADIAIYSRFYIFNVTNPEDVLALRHKPILEELGPYTFREHREKVNIVWNNENGTVSYKVIRRWNFISEKTNGSLNDTVVHLNVPMVSAGNDIHRHYSGDNQQFFYEAINSIVEETDSTLFKKNSVGELLFEGYDEPLLIAAKAILPDTPYTRFGWFYAKNNTSSDGIFNMNTGQKDINKLGLLDSWNYLNYNNKWFGQKCQQFDKSSAGDFQPPYILPKPKKLEIFVADICRSIPLEYLTEVDFKGIKAHRYWLSPAVFDYALDENRCYCGTDRCPANGVLNISVCTLGSPAAISLPHFLYADSTYSKSIDGVNPDPSFHSFFIDYENTLGIPLNINARLQINVILNQNDNLEFSANRTQSQLYLPQFWFSVSASVDDNMVKQLDFLINGVPYYICVITILFLFISCLTLMSAAVYAYRCRKSVRLDQRRKYETVDMISTSFSN